MESSHPPIPIDQQRLVALSDLSSTLYAVLPRRTQPPQHLSRLIERLVRREERGAEAARPAQPDPECGMVGQFNRHPH